MSASGQILVVDDDPAIATVLAALLRQAGHSTISVQTGEAALAALDSQHVDVVLTDVRMPGIDGMQLLERIVQQRPDFPVILLTAHGTVPLAVEAMKHGAADFLLKPFDREEILFVIGKVLTALDRHCAPPERPQSKAFIAQSPAMRAALDVVRRAAAGTATVLIRGESGTGKEVVARALHDASPRRDGPFVKLNCAALPETLLESELFGYEKGAFTGAAARKLGRIELADAGTLLLDEIGDVPLPMQVKLLRVIQDRELERLGGRETIRVDVRFVAATHRDLETMVAAGRFREDLFYRLDVVPIWLPPLRERRGDVELLARSLCARHAAANDRSPVELDAEAIAVLAAQPWPGNVRQLENLVERLVVLATGPTIAAEDVRRELARDQAGVAKDPSPRGTPVPYDLTLDNRRRSSEREALTAALERAGNNRTLAARLLGVSRRTLYTKLADHGLL